MVVRSFKGAGKGGRGRHRKPKCVSKFILNIINLIIIRCSPPLFHEKKQHKTKIKMEERERERK